MSTGKSLVREISGLMFLAQTQLDEAGLVHLKSLKEVLSKQPPSVLIGALVDWSKAGRPTMDPRPPIVRGTSEQSKTERRTYGRGPF